VFRASPPWNLLKKQIYMKILKKKSCKIDMRFQEIIKLFKAGKPRMEKMKFVWPLPPLKAQMIPEGFLSIKL